MMISKIELKGMRFYSFHGVAEQERVVGNHFVVDIALTANLAKAIENDSVYDTINYASVYDIVKGEMSIPSNLLEHVAGRILRSIKHNFPQIEELEVKLKKTIPPIGGDLDSAAIILTEKYAL